MIKDVIIRNASDGLSRLRPKNVIVASQKNKRTTRHGQADRLDLFVPEKSASMLDRKHELRNFKANLLERRTINRSVLWHIFPVISPVISLLFPCYDFRPETTYSSTYA